MYIFIETSMFRKLLPRFEVSVMMVVCSMGPRKIRGVAVLEVISVVENRRTTPFL